MDTTVLSLLLAVSLQAVVQSCHAEPPSAIQNRYYWTEKMVPRVKYKVFWPISFLLYSSPTCSMHLVSPSLTQQVPALVIDLLLWRDSTVKIIPVEENV